jgi:type II secretory pathway pseudopilin PulG
MIRRDYLFQIVGWGAGAALYGLFKYYTNKKKAAQKQQQERQQHSHQDHQIDEDSEWKERHEDEWRGEETNFEQYDAIDPLKEERS